MALDIISKVASAVDAAAKKGEEVLGSAGSSAAAVGEAGKHGAASVLAAVAAATSKGAATGSGLKSAAQTKGTAATSDAAGAPRTGTDLVLEGGGMRGMFTAGVLDMFQERGVFGFDTVWGVSAGAINAASYLSHQQGRYLRECLAFRDDRRFMSLWSLATTGDMAGADFLYHRVQDDIDPFDYEAFAARRSRFMVVATDVVFGTPSYLEVRNLPEDIDRVRASASLPVISRVVQVGQERLLDGGTADSVPVERALAEGAERAVVVLTQHREYEKKGPYELQPLADRRYSDFPYYLEALRTRAARYNEQRQHIWQLEREGKAVVIAPSEPVVVGSTSGADGEGLLRLYLDGRRQGAAALDAVRAFGA